MWLDGEGKADSMCLFQMVMEQMLGGVLPVDKLYPNSV